MQSIRDNYSPKSTRKSKVDLCEPSIRPRICELFDTTTAHDYTVLDQEIYRQWQQQEPPSVVIPRGIKHRSCYLCNKTLDLVHWFYHSQCPACGEVSYLKRHTTRDLTGYQAIVTGGRVKLGYQIALKLLRAGASVLVTSRNWTNALERYQDEPDYETWKDRLHVCRINFDLLQLDKLLPAFNDELNRVWPTNSAVDIVVHNAAQTIFDVAEGTIVKASKSLQDDTVQSKLGLKTPRDTQIADEQVIDERPTKYARHNDEEKSPVKVSTEIPTEVSTETPTKAPTNRNRHYPPEAWVNTVFPETDRYQRKLDERESNTWSTEFGDVNPEEAKQVLIANAWAPFVLNQFLLPRLKTSTKSAYIIHVHAKEGHFESHKTLCHMHTNMAKAALCMMTRCLTAPSTGYVTRSLYQEQWSADVPWLSRYETKMTDIEPSTHTRHNEHRLTKDISVHGVDPGWFSVDEYTIETRIKKNLYFSVIDEIDAAARVLYPVFIQAPSFPGTWRHYVPLLKF